MKLVHACKVRFKKKEIQVKYALCAIGSNTHVLACIHAFYSDDEHIEHSNDICDKNAKQNACKQRNAILRKEIGA